MVPHRGKAPGHKVELLAFLHMLNREFIVASCRKIGGIDLRIQRFDIPVQLCPVAVTDGISATALHKLPCLVQKTGFTGKRNSSPYNIGKELLKKNPVSLQLLYNMYGIAGLLQKDIREIKHYSKRYAALLTMIALTGDGTSEETAFKVICVNDEYQLLNMLFKMENMKGQSLVNKCDLIEFDKCQYYEGNQMYFDISRSLDYMSELFGK